MDKEPRLYAIEAGWNSADVKIVSTLFEEKHKTYRIRSNLLGFECKRVISKDDPIIAFSPEEAVSLYVERQTQHIKLHEKAIHTAKERIEKAKRLLVSFSDTVVEA